MTTATITAAETAYLLRRELGPLRQWRDFLADAIRDRARLNGLTLLPCGKQHDGRAFRPVYDARAVKAFIDTILAAVPTAGRSPITATKLDIDPSQWWHLNRFDRMGTPLQIVGLRASRIDPTGAAGLPPHQPPGATMQHLDMQQTADFLEGATIENTTDTGHAIVHIGASASGTRFVLVNDCHGRTTLSEAM